MREVAYLFERYSRDGYIIGDRIRELFLQFPISRTDLALIWYECIGLILNRELADMDRDGKLSFDEFQVFVRFIGERIKQPNEVKDSALDLLVEEHEFLVEENGRLSKKVDILMQMQTKD